jgi:hypothetical protein
MLKENTGILDNKMVDTLVHVIYLIEKWTMKPHGQKKQKNTLKGSS